MAHNKLSVVDGLFNKGFDIETSSPLGSLRFSPTLSGHPGTWIHTTSPSGEQLAFMLDLDDITMLRNFLEIMQVDVSQTGEPRPTIANARTLEES